MNNSGFGQTKKKSIIFRDYYTAKKFFRSSFSNRNEKGKSKNK